MSIDVLAIGAHPDDADLGVGGLLCKLGRAGKSAVVLDLTKGELGSRGTAAERKVEALESARLLGILGRRNAGLPDGGIMNTPEQRLVLIRILRELKPALLLAPMAPDRHPDHSAAHSLVRDANFFAGVHGVDTGQAPHRAGTVYYYRAYESDEESPTHVVDISAVFEHKLTALRAFRSQFYNPDYTGPETLIASSAFWEGITTRAEYWGARIGVRYGEPLYGTLPVAMDLPPELEKHT
ncbi:MAG: bacillithiol biosynthesis deacetylase BshB1 [Candidatus Hydrogenedentes bacterium]|nr:bacillithiol biosynthesis deacetylase BshB1 [Candidatus Hydrogenedentota bacterium]